MKRWAILISLIAFLLSLSGPTFAAETPLKTITVAVPAVSLLQAPLFVAIDAGAFKKYGMDVRYVLTGARTIQALIGGSVQFAAGCFSRTVPSRSSGRSGRDIDRQLRRQVFVHDAQRAPKSIPCKTLKGKVMSEFPASAAAPTSLPAWPCAKWASSRQGRSDSWRRRSGRDRGGHEGEGRPCGHPLAAIFIVAQKAGFKICRHDELEVGLRLLGAGGYQGVACVQPGTGETVSHGNDRGGEDFKTTRSSRSAY